MNFLFILLPEVYKLFQTLPPGRARAIISDWLLGPGGGL